MHLMKALAALIVAWISKKIGLRVSSIAFKVGILAYYNNSFWDSTDENLKFGEFNKVSPLGSRLMFQSPVVSGTTQTCEESWTLWHKKF